MTKKWKTIRCSQSVFDRLDFISKVLNRKKSAFLDELFIQFFDIFSEFESANIMYTSERQKLIINAYGKSNLIVGTYTAPTAKQESKVPAIVKIIPETKVKKDAD